MTKTEDDKKKIAVDGERIFVNLAMMDAQQRDIAARDVVNGVLHRPGYIGDHRRHGPGERLEREAAATAENAKKDTAREKYKSDLANAWKAPPPTPRQQDRLASDEFLAAHDAAVNSIKPDKQTAALANAESKDAMYRQRDMVLENAWRHN